MEGYSALPTTAGGYVAGKRPPQQQFTVPVPSVERTDNSQQNSTDDTKICVRIPKAGKCRSRLGLNFKAFVSPFSTQGCYQSWLAVFLMEVLATAAFVWLGVMVSGSTTLEPIRNVVGPWGWAAGAFLASAAWTYWIVHLNPILTLALFFLSDNDKHRDPAIAFFRIAGEFAGAFLGTALALVLVGYSGVALSAVYPRAHGVHTVGSYTVPAVDYTQWHGFAAELLAGTWVVLATVFVLIVYSKPVDESTSNGTAHLDLRGLLATMFINLVGLYSIWNITGAGLNIVRIVAVNTVAGAWGFAGEQWACPVGAVVVIVPVIVLAYLKHWFAAQNKKMVEEEAKAEDKSK